MSPDDISDLIAAFIVKEQYWKAVGNDDRVAGIRECIIHLQEYLTYYVNQGDEA